MALTTHTVTLETKKPGSPDEALEGVWTLSVAATPPILENEEAHYVFAGRRNYDTEKVGVAPGKVVLTLPATGQPNVEPEDAKWRLEFTSTDKKTQLGPYVFELVEDLTLDKLTEASGVTLVPSFLTQAYAARDAALAAAAGIPRVGRIQAEAYKPSRTDLQAIHAACAAATALTRGAVVELSSRTWDVEDGLSMDGYSCGLVGLGVSHDAGGSGHLAGSVLHAPTQDGPVLDLDGWTVPSSFRGKVEFGLLGLRGSGAADPTKANSGLHRGSVAISSVTIHDIVTSETGGPGVDVFDLYLSDVERVTAVTPVGAKANDVPYMVFRAGNGNRLYGLGFRSMDSSNDVGVSGALILRDDGTGNTCTNDVVKAPWFEFLHMPTGGTLITVAANRCKIEDPYFVDCAQEAGATDTSFVHFAVPAGGAPDQGGNELTGVIPGAQAGVNTTGVLVSQSRNRITGAKGYNGGNVTLETGVEFTYAALGGSVSGTGVSSAYVDNSGKTNNTLLDYARYPGTGRLPSTSFVTKTADTTRNNTAAATADPDLTIPVDKNAVYLIEGCIFYSTTATADLRLGLTCPSLATLLWSPDAPSTSVSNATSTAPHRGTLTTSGGNASIGGTAAGTQLMAKPTGKLITGSTAGSLTVQWAQLVAEASDSVVHAGSWLRLTRIA